MLFILDTLFLVLSYDRFIDLHNRNVDEKGSFLTERVEFDANKSVAFEFCFL